MTEQRYNEKRLWQETLTLERSYNQALKRGDHSTAEVLNEKMKQVFQQIFS